MTPYLHEVTADDSRSMVNLNPHHYVFRLLGDSSDDQFPHPRGT